LLGQRKINLELSVNWLVAPFVVAIVLLLLFIFGRPDWRPALVFGAAVVGGAAALTTAINALDARIAQAKQARIDAALAAVYRWNTPELHHVKKNCREMVEHFKAHAALEEQVAYIKADVARLMNLFDLLNSFEALALAVSADVVDEAIAKRFFKSMCVHYWHTFEKWIRNHRAERDNARLYREFEALYERWKND
jgi:hypothetical protein